MKQTDERQLCSPHIRHRLRFRWKWLVIIFAGGLLSLQGASSQQPEDPQRATIMQALERLNPVIGEWRGIGQVRRGSAQGAWQQTGQFVWDFNEAIPAIRYVVEKGQLTDSARLTWTPVEKYLLVQKTPDGEERRYQGDWTDGKLVLTSPSDVDGVQQRVTLTLLNDKRTLVLHEKTAIGGETFFRVAEVGYTRAGTRLALPGGGQRECIVTGGTAQTAVTYQGETYYVCCTGCQQAFNDDPAGIIAEFKARLKSRLDGLK